MSFFDIKAIAQRLETQDNAATAHPVFVVQERERIWDVTSDYADGIIWLDDEGEEHEPEEGVNLPAGFSEVGYLDRWDFVVACFTRAAAERYIEENRHNLRDPRVWVASAHRNKEWQIAAASFKTMARAIARLERFVGERPELPLNLFGMIDTLVRRAESYAQEVRRGP